MSRHPENWRPAASLDALRVRAEVMATIRSFFAGRGVLEVETPVLSSNTVTDVHLSSLACPTDDLGKFFLQTSPEFHMKRLLAAGCGPIYQICKAFRGGESGRRHNPEFTMLEWYRPGWDHHGLMDEVEALLADVLCTPPAERLSYGEAFHRHAAIDPHGVADEQLLRRVVDLGVQDPESLDRNDLLNLVLTHVVEGKLGRGRPSFIHDFPAGQAALAKIRPGDPPLAERFEVFVEGIELANGYNELIDPDEQRRRFERDLETRRLADHDLPAMDDRLLAALEAGLPPCAGVAFGVDRLVMLKLGTRDISDVIAFPIDRA